MYMFTTHKCLLLTRLSAQLLHKHPTASRSGLVNCLPCAVPTWLFGGTCKQFARENRDLKPGVANLEGVTAEPAMAPSVSRRRENHPARTGQHRASSSHSGSEGANISGAGVSSPSFSVSGNHVARRCYSPASTCVDRRGGGTSAAWRCWQDKGQCLPPSGGSTFPGRPGCLWDEPRRLPSSIGRRMAQQAQVLD